MPPFDGGDDLGRILCPSEGSRVGVGLSQEAIDRSLQLDDRAKHASFEPALGQFGEKSFDGVEPGGGCRGEVEDEVRMFPDPFHDLGMLVDGIVIDDDMEPSSAAPWHQ